MKIIESDAKHRYETALVSEQCVWSQQWLFYFQFILMSLFIITEMLH